MSVCLYAINLEIIIIIPLLLYCVHEGIETALDRMAKAWQSVLLQVETYKDTGTCILKGLDDYMTLLDEHITLTQAMAFSAFKGYTPLLS